MQIKCPSCKQTNTTIPQALLGRIYVCGHCHRILRLKSLTPHMMQWRPLATTLGDASGGWKGRWRPGPRGR
mgnify:CR=1 FL=1